MQREVGRDEGQVLEERLPRVFAGMLLQAADGMLGNGRAGVVAVCRLDGRQRLVVFAVQSRREVVVVIVELVGMIEAAVGEDGGRP